ncbi:ammonium transporter Rh type A-like [Molothrus ater]|uniref:ammonium transporter Rh type A-like n=1 Tax=Molothrus ater TaxID=84834 RepID=UPI00174DF360|nr:ammonium transporter Rh type A-like [Molothrus ater]
MRQAGWSGGEDGGRKRTGYLEPTANSWAYLCAAEAQESLQNSAQLERGPRLGTRPRPSATPGARLGGGMLVAGRGHASRVGIGRAGSPPEHPCPGEDPAATIVPYGTLDPLAGGRMAVPPSTYPRRLLPLFLGLFQGALLLFFALFVTYDEPSAQVEDTSLVANQVYSTFPFFQDIQVMLVVGLGLLLTFLPRYGFSALTHNFLLLNFSVQWALVLQGLLHHFHHGQIHLDLHKLLLSEFAAVTVLISVGAILGRASPCQLLVMATCEIAFYLASEWVIVTCLGVLDVGGTITIHVFSCYFGLGVSKALFRATQQPLHPKETPTTSSDLMSLVGTLILWVFWPSFVAVLCQPGDAQHRAILNTLLAMSASAITTVVASSLLDRDGKLSPSHLQNGSLAGGVAIGVVADMAVPPVAALALGSLSAVLCVLGFRFLTPLLARKLTLHDQCGIHNLHGLPGILGAAASIVAVLVAPKDGGSRGVGGQALCQAAGLAVAVGASLLAGLLTGSALRLPCLARPPERLCFDDLLYFKIHDQAESPGPDSSAEEGALALKEQV